LVSRPAESGDPRKEAKEIVDSRSKVSKAVHAAAAAPAVAPAAPATESPKQQATVPSEPPKIDLSAATFLDVAVLRCLFIPQWQEEGVFWALQFLYHR